ncbi:MAG: hypothetical protein K8953_11720, partial [Proteobacteria bacterium]|nr:hypothetical protein [Pseudomonadota bacterium]
MTACGVNPGDPVCDDDFPNKVTVGDWSRAQPALLNTIPTEKNQFLTTLGGIISTQGTTAPTDITTVTLSDVYYDPVTISGDAADGFSYFTAGDYSYVGILDSTDLGAPSQGFNGAKAIWHGQLNFRNVAREFAININYDSGGGTVDGFFADIVGTTDFALHGDFNEHGLITGDTKFAEYTNDIFDGMAINTPDGILSGIIGQEGAVGVFHSTALGADGYVGGFIAHPEVVDIADVNYNDWIRGKRYFINPTSGTRFLRTTDGVIRTEIVMIEEGVEVRTPLVRLSPVTYLTLNNAKFGLKNKVIVQNTHVNYTYNDGGIETPDGTYLGGITLTIDFNYKTNTFEGAEFGGDAKDGLAYFRADGRGFAGILDTTNLGRPLTETTGKTTWRGQLAFISSVETASRDFALTITFNGTGGEIDGGVDGFLFGRNKIQAEFLLEGNFNSQGLISGNTFFARPDTNPSRIGQTIKYDHGTLTGLIGQEGAIGAFLGSTHRYSGGFVVHPDVTDKVVYADWVQANPVPGVKKDNDGRLIPSIPGLTDFESAVVLRGIFDDPVKGNHFLTTKNDVMSVGRKLTEDD